HSMTSADQKFDQLDENQDRSLSKSEAAADETLSATFASIDADGDGELSRSEFTAHLAESEGQSESDWSDQDQGESDWSAPAGQEYSDANSATSEIVIDRSEPSRDRK